jgi:hypothetical protein
VQRQSGSPEDAEAFTRLLGPSLMGIDVATLAHGAGDPARVLLLGQLQPGVQLGDRLVPLRRGKRRGAGHEGVERSQPQRVTLGRQPPRGSDRRPRRLRPPPAQLEHARPDQRGQPTVELVLRARAPVGVGDQLEGEVGTPAEELGAGQGGQQPGRERPPGGLPQVSCPAAGLGEPAVEKQHPAPELGELACDGRQRGQCQRLVDRREGAGDVGPVHQRPDAKRAQAAGDARVAHLGQPGAHELGGRPPLPGQEERDDPVEEQLLPLRDETVEERLGVGEQLGADGGGERG